METLNNSTISLEDKKVMLDILILISQLKNNQNDIKNIINGLNIQ